MAGLGGADAVDDLDAEALVPAAIELRRQRLARRHAEAERREVEPPLGLLRGEHRGVERRDAEEDRGTLTRDQLEHRVRRRPLRVQHALPADAHREVARVAEAVGEEELGGRVHLVGRPEAEHLLRIGLGGDDHVVVEVDGSFGAARRARGVQPERDVVARGGRGLEGAGRPGDPVLEREMGPGRAARDQHVAEMPRALERRRRLGQEGRRDDRHPGAAVIEDVAIVRGPQERVHRDRDRADLDGAPERAEELGRIEADHDDALLHLDAQLAERVPGAIGELPHVGVAEDPTLAVERGRRAAPLGHRAVDEPARDVEFGRQEVRRVHEALLLTRSHETALLEEGHDAVGDRAGVALHQTGRGRGCRSALSGAGAAAADELAEAVGGRASRTRRDCRGRPAGSRPRPVQPVHADPHRRANGALRRDRGPPATRSRGRAAPRRAGRESTRSAARRNPRPR